MVTIEVLNPIESRFSMQYTDLATPPLHYRSVYWKQGQYGRVRKTWNKNVLLYHDKEYWYFHTGLITRITDFLNSIDQKWEVIDNNTPIFPTTAPEIQSIQLRVDQKRLVAKALKPPYRGIIVAPTGVGKTVLQGAIISAFQPDLKILWLAHTRSLIQQTIDEFKRFGISGLQGIGGDFGRSEINGRVIISTMQSFIKCLEESPDLRTIFDMAIVDEVHKAGKYDGTYFKILSQILAPIRLGFTATLPTNPEQVFAIEGLIGPVIGELSINDAADLDILAKPIIRIIEIPLNYRIQQIRNYAQSYEQGIVYNESRNKIIVQTLKEYLSVDKSVLIMVNQIEHGNQIKAVAHEMGIAIPYVQGQTEGKRREEIKKDLNDKNIHCAICTTVWKEGINIPSLDVIINASGGKTEIPVLQAIGRGLRKTDKKDKVVIVDFFDPSNHHFVNHFGHRVSLYCKNGWLGGGY